MTTKTKLDDLQVGDYLYFKTEPKELIVRDKREHFIIATSNGGQRHYTIIDTKEGFCGPDDQFFQPVNYHTEEGRREALNRLLSKDSTNRWNVCKKHGASAELLLDLERTFN